MFAIPTTSRKVWGWSKTRSRHGDYHGITEGTYIKLLDELLDTFLVASKVLGWSHRVCNVLFEMKERLF